MCDVYTHTMFNIHHVCCKIARLQKNFKPYFQNIISIKNTSTKTLLTLCVFLEGEYLCMLIKLGLMKCLKHNKTGTCMHTSQYNHAAQYR